MIESKYNKFILSAITDDISILFDVDNDILEYPVPFADYKVGDHITEEDWDLFQENYDKYVKDHNIQLISTELIDHDSEVDLYNCIFTYDKNYYKVPLEDYTYYGWETAPDWLEKDLDKYQAHQKTITKVIYE
jgi:hypothetical protein